MSSESLIEEVGNLVNSSVNRVAQAVQDHPNHLSRILWLKVKVKVKVKVKAQAVQDHPNHLFSRILWLKVKWEAPSQSQILGLKVKYWDLKWNEKHLHRVKYLLEDNCSRVVNVKQLEGPTNFVLKPDNKNCLLPVKLKCQRGQSVLKDLNSRCWWRWWLANRCWIKIVNGNTHGALLDRPNQFNGKHQFHKANGPTAVSVQDSELIQLIVYG